MADTKISSLPSASLPLAGTEVLPIVQSGTTKKVAFDGVFAAPPPLGSTTPNTVAATTLTTTSNAAIGTTSSNWGGISAALQLASYGTVASAGTVLWTGSNFYYNGGEKFVTTGKATRFAYEDGDFIWLASASGTAGNAVSFNQKMKLTESTGDLTLNAGNLVIGTSGKGITLPGGITWTSGSGSPEGVVTAPVGSLYSRTDGGLLTSLYVKQSGTGNTGWAGK